MQYRWLIFSFTALVILGCQKDKIDTSSPDYLIPESTSLVIRIDDLEKVRRDMANNDLLKNLKGLGPFKDIVKQTTILELLNAPKPFLMTYSKSTSDSSVTDVAYIVPYADSIFRLDSLSKVSQKKFKLKTKEFLTTTVDSSNYYSQKIGNFVFITPNLDLLKKAGNLKSGRSSFSELMSASKKDKPLSIVFNEGLLNESWVVRDSTEIEFSGQTLLDVDLFQNEIKFNGVTKLGDSIHFLMDAFRNTVPKAAEVPNIIPADVHYLKSLCFDSFDVFNANLRALMNTDEDEIPSFLRNTTEAGIILTKNNEQAIILKVIDPELSIETIETFTPVESFRSVPIYQIEAESINPLTFSPFINMDNLKVLGLIDDYMVFSESLNTIQDIITNYQNNNVLSNHPEYLKLMEHMVSESSLFIYSDESELNSIFNQELNFSDQTEAFDKNTSASIQYVIESGFSHVNGIIKQLSSANGGAGVSEEFSVSLDKELLMTPQFVENHRNGQMDILVQDINNTLYLISNEGKIFWKKSLDGKILGNVSQIDIFKNGRLQLVFATKNKVYLLDRTGRDVGKFPLSFNDDITQPLSVFDYDNNKKYRLLVTQNDQLLMYDKEGKSVSGFRYRSNGTTISSQPKHFRVRGKDYIVFSTGNKMEVLSRVGKTRINVKDKLNFSDNGIYLHENKFTTTSSSGELIAIEMNGRADRENFQLEDNHLMTATSKTLVTLSNNILKIRDNQVELNFGNYTTPQIFYINNKIYVGITDLQSKKVYLFDSQAEPIGNFPIYGNSGIDLGNMDKDDSLELVTKGNDDMVIVYEIN